MLMWAIPAPGAPQPPTWAAPRIETAIRWEDDELVQRATIAVSRYQDTRSLRWCAELGQVDDGSDSSSVFAVGVSFSF